MLAQVTYHFFDLWVETLLSALLAFQIGGVKIQTKPKKQPGLGVVISVGNQYPGLLNWYSFTSSCSVLRLMDEYRTIQDEPNMIALKVMFPVSIQFTTDSKPDTQLAAVRHQMTPGTSSSESFSFDLETPGLQSIPYLEGPALHHDYLSVFSGFPQPFVNPVVQICQKFSLGKGQWLPLNSWDLDHTDWAEGKGPCAVGGKEEGARPSAEALIMNLRIREERGCQTQTHYFRCLTCMTGIVK